MGEIKGQLAAAMVRLGMPSEHAVLAVLILLCVLSFGTLLVGCTPETRGSSNAPDSMEHAEADS
jgi:hypothetical protein